MIKEKYSPEEIADLLNVSVGFVWKKITAGEIKTDRAFVEKYVDEMKANQEKALEEMTRLGQESGQEY